MNHVVLYVRDSGRHQRFYADVLGFETIIEGAGQYVFMRAPGSNNHHDIAFFTIGEAAGPSAAGAETVGMYHIAWEVASLDDLADSREQLVEFDSLVGETDHGVSKSLYAKDPDGLEFEVMWQVPEELWGDEAHQAVIRPLDIAADQLRFARLVGDG